MINPSDVYVSGGADTLRTCWTAPVSKFDGSGFYQWEQDNLPIHDLEERDDMLWGKLGHPASSLTGMSFVVSADASDSCEPTYFTTLSGCINALPEVINYPILIEVASFGELGDLHISNKSFGPNGALEIINRNFAESVPQDSGQYAQNTQEYDANTSYGNLASSVVGNTHSYTFDPDSGAYTGALVSSLSDALAPTNNCFHALNKIYSTNEVVASGENLQDSRFFSNPPIIYSRNTGFKNNRLSVALKSSLSNYGGRELPWTTSGLIYKRIDFEPFDINSTNRADEEMDTYDVSAYDYVNSQNVVWGAEQANRTLHPVAAQNGFGAATYSYFNNLTSVRVDNCRGPVYIRGFAVDGGVSHSVDNGIEITNSTVFLEKCGASRCNYAGLKAVNSDIILSRGFVAFRNYPKDSDGNRVGIPFSEKRNNYKLKNYTQGAGIRAENSNIFIPDNANRARYFNDQFILTPPYLSVFGGWIGLGGQTLIPAPQDLFCVSRNDIGIDLVDSSILGGKNELSSISLDGYDPIPTIWSWAASYQIFSELNTEAGIRSKNSVIDYSGRILLYENLVGLDADNTTLKVDCLKSSFNQLEGVKLSNSDLTYGKDGYQGQGHDAAGADYLTVTRELNTDQITLEKNGKNLLCYNSKIKPLQVSSIPNTHREVFVSGSLGLESARGDLKNVPSIHLINSYADLTHCVVLRDYIADADQPSYGDAILADNNSTVYLRGSKSYANRIIGPSTFTAQARKAGVMANNNSTIYIQGPSVIARFAVDALADNNSKIEFSPHRDEDGQLLASAFDLDNTSNHTMVELHATRACLVADHGSVIKMEDVGSYHPFWDGNYASQIPLTQYDYLKNSETGVQAYVNQVSGGYLQFYANPIDSNAAIPSFSLSKHNFTPDSDHPTLKGLGLTASSYLYSFTTGGDEYAISAVTKGGMCVRALNNSEVEVNNVHFPTGWPNTSAIAYDIDGLANDAACSRLHIWNIADNSILNAKYITVSGAHPRDAGYYGPSGTWGVSEAPSDTPDTSSLSVLDFYGRDSGGENRYGKSDFENFGPFRLYFSVDPVANYLVDPDTVVSGLPIQIFSQGYAFSGNLSAPGAVSSQYISVLKDNGTDIVTSGFYYVNELAFSEGVKAVLDDSGSNTWANAKHNSVGKSNIPKQVHLYDAYDTVFGGDSLTNSDNGTGLGSVNNFDLKKDN